MSKNDDRKKILLVDGDEVQLVLTGEMLKDKYNISAARSGKEAIDFFHQGFFPDLLDRVALAIGG